MSASHFCKSCCPHPKSLSRGERDFESGSLLPSGEGLGMRASMICTNGMHSAAIYQQTDHSNSMSNGLLILFENLSFFMRFKVSINFWNYNGFTQSSRSMSVDANRLGSFK